MKKKIVSPLVSIAVLIIFAACTRADRGTTPATSESRKDVNGANPTAPGSVTPDPAHTGETPPGSQHAADVKKTPPGLPETSRVTPVSPAKSP